MSEGLEFPYEDLWYIRLPNEAGKNPREAWGGYSQNFEAAEQVYSHDEVLESSHEYWGVVGIRGEDRYLLIFDLDVYKEPTELDRDTISVPNETLIVRSQRGGHHVYFVINDQDGPGNETDFTMTYDLGFDIDIREAT